MNVTFRSISISGGYYECEFCRDFEGIKDGT